MRKKREENAMLINLRNALMTGKKSPLPHGARWVEYLESTGTQYIDTGVLVADNALVEATFELLAIDNAVVFGGRRSASYNSFVVWAATSADKKIRFDFMGNSASGAIRNTIETVLNKEYRVSKIGPRNYIDGVEVQSNSNQPSYVAEHTCYLFALNNGGTASFIGNCRIKGFSIGNEINFRPIAIGTTGYMLDLVSGEYLPYGNKGTGDFVIGPDIPSPV